MPERTSVSSTEKDVNLEPRSLWSVARVVMPVSRLLVTPTPALGVDTPVAKSGGFVAIGMYAFAEPVSVTDAKRAAARRPQGSQDLPVLPRRNYCQSEEGLRANGFIQGRQGPAPRLSLTQNGDWRRPGSAAPHLRSFNVSQWTWWTVPQVGSLSTGSEIGANDCATPAGPLAAAYVAVNVAMRRRGVMRAHSLSTPALVLGAPTRCGRLPAHTRARVRRTLASRGEHRLRLRARIALEALNDLAG